jgi:hypothetical protein
MARNPDGDAVQPGASQVADARVSRTGVTRVKGPGQKASAKARAETSNTPTVSAASGIRDMRNQGIEARPSLGLEDGGHRLGLPASAPSP